MVWLLGGYIWLFIHRPFEYWPVLGDLQIERLYMMLTMLCSLIYLARKPVLNRLHVAFLGFTTALVVCWVYSPYADLGEKAVEDWLKVAVFYLLMILTVRDERTLRTLVLIYLVAVGLYMTHSLLEFINGRHFFRMGIRRMIGVDQTYNDPNTFSATLLYSLPLTLPFWKDETRRWLRLPLVAYILLTVVCILLTGSRGGLVGLIFLVMIGLWRSQYRMRLVFLLPLAAPLVWLLLPDELKGRFTTLIDPSAGPVNAQQSASGRLQGFLDGVALWQRNPTTGFGPNSFGQAVGHGFQAHNLYGQTLGELGTLGFLGLAGIVLAFYLNDRELRRTYARDELLPRDFAYHLTRAVSLAVILLLVMGLGSHNLYRYTWMWFGAFQAIALHCVRARAAEGALVPLPRFTRAAGLNWLNMEGCHA